MNSETKVYEEVKPATQDTRSGTVFTGYTVMAKSMIGSGILSICFACASCGLIMGIGMLVFAAALTLLSLHVLSKLSCEFKSDDITFYSISEKVIPRVKWLIDAALLLDLVGSAICYVQTMGSLLATPIMPLIADSGLSRSSLIMIVQASLTVALFPLCMLRDISNTKIANIIGMVCLVYVAIMAFVYADLPDSIPTRLLQPVSIMKAIQGFPIFIFAFACQSNILSVASEMKGVTVKKMFVVSSTAISTGVLMFLPVMILPFLSFPDRSDPSHVFLALLPRTLPVQIGYVCAAVSVAISYVLVVHPLRRSIYSLIWGGNFPTGRREIMFRFIIVSAVVLASLGVAMLAGESLGPTLEFTGLLGGNTVGFVMPAFIYLKHFGWKSSKTSFAVLAMFIFCCALYPLCLTSSILDLVK